MSPYKSSFSECAEYQEKIVFQCIKTDATEYRLHRCRRKEPDILVIASGDYADLYEYTHMVSCHNK